MSASFSEDASEHAVICSKMSLRGFPSEFISNSSYSEVHIAQAATLQPGQIRHLLRVTASTSRHPERDCLILWLGLTAGMRVTEIAQIEVQDVLFPSGALRSEISLRGAIMKGCRQRCIYLGHAKTIEAVDSTWTFESQGASGYQTIQPAIEAWSRRAS
jgi:integrase/recombinase XerD